MNMNKELKQNVRLGIFVLAGGILLIFGLYSIGKNKNMFGKSIRVISVFSDVNGLSEGNNVRYSGIDVGTVEKIEIVNDSAIRIEMLISKEVMKFIRKNSVASIGTDGLMGNKLINIAPGTNDAPMIVENDTIFSLKAVNTEEMLRTLDLTNSNIAVISSNLKDITEKVSRSRGTLYTVLTDTILANRVDVSLRNIEFVSNNLVQTSNQLSIFVNDVSQGKGVLGMAVSDTALPNDIRTAVKNIRTGSEEFSRITEEFSATVKEMNSGKGTVTTLLKDTTMAGDLKRSISNMESATQKLDQNLDALKNSFLFRDYFKRLERANEKQK